MKFYIDYGNSEDNEVVYFTEEKSFDTCPSLNVDMGISVAYLNIEIDSDDMCVKCLWGFNPENSWCDTELFIPIAECGRLILKGNHEPGKYWRIDRGNTWKSYFDEKKGWFCIGNVNVSRTDKAVRVNRNTIFVLNDSDELKSIFIHLNRK